MDDPIEFIIDFTVEDSEPIEIEMLSDDPIEMEYHTGDILYVRDHLSYRHTLSQIDINNKYVTVTELAEITDKPTVQIFVAQCGIKLHYLTDYIINQYNQIYWNGYLAEGQLAVGDTLEIYY